MSRVEELASTEIGFKDSEGLKPFHLAIFVLVLSAGLWFLTVLLYFTADIKLQQACLKVLRRLLKTVALRQVMGILAAMTFVRFGLEPLVKMLRKIFVAPGTWEKSSEYYILKEVSLLYLAYIPYCSITPLADLSPCASAVVLPYQTHHQAQPLRKRCFFQSHEWQSVQSLGNL